MKNLSIKFGLLIQFAHLKSSSYKEGTKPIESSLGYFCGIKTFSGKNKLRLPQNIV